MKINTSNWLAVGVLSVGFWGLALPATAAPDKGHDEKRELRDAKRDVRDERRDIYRADSPRERREEIREYQDAKRDLREEKHDNHNGWNGCDNHNDWNNHNGWNGYGQNQRRTLQGIVTQDLSGNDFTIRQGNGQSVRVVAVNGESGRISRGDTVRVYGAGSNGNFHAQSISIVRNR